MFDKASTWWSLEDTIKPNSRDLEVRCEKMIRDQDRKDQETNEEEEKSTSSKAKSPWKTGVSEFSEDAIFRSARKS